MSDFSRTEGDPLLHSVIDERYRIDARIGSGGMGAVYRAHQLSTGRDVAIKLLLPGLANEDAVRRFQNEARAIATLRSPHTLKLIDSGRMPSGQLYIVTELLVGAPLSGLLRDGGLGIARSLGFISQTCSSLQEAHGVGIVHRDLKPANIFIETIGEQEHLKVLDFGIAKLSEQPNLTGSGILLGTPNYMSPEQAEGKGIDARSDLYSLGVVLFHCIKGRLPFTAGSAVALLMKHVHEPAPPLESGIAELDNLVLRLMSKDPAARLESAANVQRALARMLRALPHEDEVEASTVDATRATSVETPNPGAAQSDSVPVVQPSPPQPRVSEEMQSAAMSQTFSQTVSRLDGVVRKPGKYIGLSVVALAAATGIIWAAMSDRLASQSGGTSSQPTLVSTPLDAGAKEALQKEEAKPEPVVESLPQVAITKAINAESKRLQACRAKAKDSRRGMAIELEFNYETSGRVVDSRVTSGPRNARLRECVLEVLRDVRFERGFAGIAEHTVVYAAKATRRSPRAPPSKAVTGKLSIRVQTSSGRKVPTEIRLEGKSIGKHSRLTKALPPGVYQLELHPEGYPVQRRRVTIRAGKTTVIRSTAD